MIDRGHTSTIAKMTVRHKITRVFSQYYDTPRDYTEEGALMRVIFIQSFAMLDKCAAGGGCGLLTGDGVRGQEERMREPQKCGVPLFIPIHSGFRGWRRQSGSLNLRHLFDIVIFAKKVPAADTRSRPNLNHSGALEIIKVWT